MGGDGIIGHINWSFDVTISGHSVEAPSRPRSTECQPCIVTHRLPSIHHSMKKRRLVSNAQKGTQGMGYTITDI